MSLSDISPSRHPANRWTRRICEEFEQAWNGNDPPQLQDYLIHTNDLFVELLVADIGSRVLRKHALDRGDYERKYPEFADAIAEAFRRYEKLREGAAGLTDDDPYRTLHYSGDRRDDARQDTSTGRFRVMHSHAKGGLGEVFVAMDIELQRRVALKQIQQPHADDASYRTRFVFEAEITGCLEHPGVVPVYSLGRHQDGRPYYAMRFIKGQSLSDAIVEYHAPGKTEKAKEVKLRDLLQRYVTVCNTMAYAHDRRILHRDIKPANIMVGSYGETLVVDWGLAKSLQTGGTSSGISEVSPDVLATGGQTRAHGAVGTPQYMSPEQAEGAPVERATDIYSLGATLTKLLTGQNPVDSETASDTIAKVRRGEVRSPRQIDPTVPRPLDAICRKAMSFDAEKRYPTAKDLAADIECWLADLPVEAYKASETTIEKSYRWMRKHRSWVLAGSVALLCVSVLSATAAAIVASAWRSEYEAKQQTARMHDEAIQHYRASRDSVDKWVTGTSEALRFFPGTQELRKRLLQEAAADYARLAELQSEDLDLERERVRGLVRLADVYQLLEDFENAEQHYQDAIELLANLPVDDESNSKLHDEVRARTRLGALFVDMNRPADAELQFQAVFTAIRASTDANVDSITIELKSIALVNHANLLAIRGDIERSEHELQEAIRSYQLLIEQSPENVRYVSLLAIAHQQLGMRFVDRGKHEQAIEHFILAADQLTAAVRSEPDHPDYLDAEADILISLANSCRILGRLAVEEDALSRAALRYEALHTALPDVPRYRENLALTRTDIGIMLLDSGRSREAEIELRKAIGDYEELVADYGVPRYQEGLAACEGALGQALADLSNVEEEARDRLWRSVLRLRNLRTLYPTVPHYLERLCIALSHHASVSPDPTALVQFEEAIAGLRGLVELAPDRPDYTNELAHVYEKLGDHHFREGNTADAIKAYQSARERWTALVAVAPSPEYLNSFAWFLANCLAESVRLRDKAIEHAAAAHEAAPDNATYCNTLAAAHYRADRFAEAESLLREAIQLRGAGNARDYYFLAMAQCRTGEQDEARRHFKLGDEWMAENQPENEKLILLREEVAQLLGSPSDSPN